MKKWLALAMTMIMTAASLVGCAQESANGTSGNTNGNSGSATNSNGTELGAISVLSREDGSGTRGAFIELMGIEQKDADGKKVDRTVDTAEITNSTSVMMTTVAGNASAIGYISLGSLDKSVKALKVDGTAPSVEAVKDGSYKVSRPFNIATKAEISDLAQDFINFILSAQGQAVVEDHGYISQGNNGDFTSNGATGKIVVGGSSSVTPVMEKLKEAYTALNANAVIEIQQSDSTTGMNDAIEGICDIGMASRELKDSELEAGLQNTVIALDGIAVIVNNDNPLEGVTSEQVMKIYTGEITNWSELQ